MFYLFFYDQNQIQKPKTNFSVLESIYLIIQNKDFIKQIKEVVESLEPRVFINKELKLNDIIVKICNRDYIFVFAQKSRIMINPNELFSLFDEWNKEQCIVVKTLRLYFDGYKFILKKFDNINDCKLEESQLDKKDFYISVSKKFDPNYGIVFSNSNNNKMYLIDQLIHEPVILIDMYYSDKFKFPEIGFEICLQHTCIKILDKNNIWLSDSDKYPDFGISLKLESLFYLIDKYKEIEKYSSILDLKKLVITYQDGYVTLDYELPK